MDSVQTSEIADLTTAWHSSRMHLTFRTAPYGGITILLTEKEANLLIETLREALAAKEAA